MVFELLNRRAWSWTEQPRPPDTKLYVSENVFHSMDIGIGNGNFLLDCRTAQSYIWYVDYCDWESGLVLFINSVPITQSQAMWSCARLSLMNIKLLSRCVWIQMLHS